MTQNVLFVKLYFSGAGAEERAEWSQLKNWRSSVNGWGPEIASRLTALLAERLAPTIGEKDEMGYSADLADLMRLDRARCSIWLVFWDLETGSVAS